MKFTGTEQIFANINTFISRDTDPTNTQSYNPRFALLLQAINSSESLQASVLQAQTAGVKFENGSNFSEDASQPVEDIRFIPIDNAIRLPDSYFMEIRGNTSGIDAFASERSKYGEMIVTVSHEISHSLRAAQVSNEYNDIRSNFQNSNKTSVDISKYILIN